MWLKKQLRILILFGQKIRNLFNEKYDGFFYAKKSQNVMMSIYSMKKCSLTNF